MAFAWDLATRQGPSVLRECSGRPPREQDLERPTSQEAIRCPLSQIARTSKCWLGAPGKQGELSLRSCRCPAGREERELHRHLDSVWREPWRRRLPPLSPSCQALIHLSRPSAKVSFSRQPPGTIPSTFCISTGFYREWVCLPDQTVNDLRKGSAF